MGRVVACPQNMAEVKDASKRLGCKTDEYGNNQYMCLANSEKTSLVEICHDGLMGIKEKGNCLELSNGKLNVRSCKHFKFGCPDEPIRINEYYKHKACLAIDFKNHCYNLDPACPPRHNGSIDTTNVSDNNGSELIIYIVLSLIIVSLVCIIAFLLWKGKRKTNGRQNKDKHEIEEEACIIVDGKKRKTNGRQNKDKHEIEEEACLIVDERIQQNQPGLESQHLPSNDEDHTNLKRRNNASSKTAGREVEVTLNERIQQNQPGLESQNLPSNDDHTNLEGRNNASCKAAGREVEVTLNERIQQNQPGLEFQHLQSNDDDEDDEDDEDIPDEMETVPCPKRKRHDTETSVTSVGSFVEDQIDELEVFNVATKAR